MKPPNPTLTDGSYILDWTGGRYPAVYGSTDGNMYLWPTAMITQEPRVHLSNYTRHLRLAYGWSHTDAITRYQADFDAAPDTPAKLIQAAGQGCYASYLSKFTSFEESDAYVGNLMTQAHFSVFEHVHLTFFLAGISRTLLGELTRHRHSDGPSVQSQRYVDRTAYRFVARPEYLNNVDLYSKQKRQTIQALEHYDQFAEDLRAVWLKESHEFEAKSAREQRISVNQAARGVLPGWTETNGFWTWNIRSILHILSLRGSLYAEVEIRRLAWVLLWLCKESMPDLFRHFTHVDPDPTNGWKAGLNIPYHG